MKVIVVAGAEVDLEEAYDYYNAIRRPLADDFMEEFRRAVKRILQDPFGWQKMDEVYRRCRLHRFPYGIVYRVDQAADLIVITTIMHLNRHPDSWRRL